MEKSGFEKAVGQSVATKPGSVAVRKAPALHEGFKFRGFAQSLKRHNPVNLASSIFNSGNVVRASGKGVVRMLVNPVKNLAVKVGAVGRADKPGAGHGDEPYFSERDDKILQRATVLDALLWDELEKLGPKGRRYIIKYLSARLRQAQGVQS